ncbi:MAG: hypothetical protein N2692_03040 [Patescibacteria group bacterium]|nr:hypothetical protein [Patescibacteria group bacterium]
MADLYFKKYPDNITFECYSERGVISFLMLKWLTEDKDNINKFIGLIEDKNKNNPLKNFKPSQISIFTELVLGFRGFGCPDGLLYLKNEIEEKLIFIEAKTNENAEESCNLKKSSSLNNQIELKMRMLHHYFKDPQKTIIRAINPNNKKENRTLELKDGVKVVFEYIKKFEQKTNDVYFLIITKDSKNPILEFEKKLNKVSLKKDVYPKYKKQICWINFETLINLTGLKNHNGGCAG